MKEKEDQNQQETSFQSLKQPTESVVNESELNSKKDDKYNKTNQNTINLPTWIIAIVTSIYVIFAGFQWWAIEKQSNTLIKQLDIVRDQLDLQKKQFTVSIRPEIEIVPIIITYETSLVSGKKYKKGLNTPKR